MDLHEAIGHLSFGLTATSWMLRSVLWLRLTAMVATALGIWFNYSLPPGPLWQVIAWLSLFQAINLVQVGLLIRDMSEWRLTNREKSILVAAWPQMHSRDFMKLLRRGTSLQLAPETQLLGVGNGTDALWLVVDGHLVEERDDGTRYELGVGSTIGGATFIARDNLGGSPSNVAAGPRGASVIRWSYPLLHQLVEKLPRLGGPLYEGITRGMIVKYRMLREHETAPIGSYRNLGGSLMPTVAPTRAPKSHVASGSPDTH